MSNNQPLSEDKDPELWNLAKKRAGFKVHLATYLIMNVFFWILWYFTGLQADRESGLPWPVWPMLGWGIGIVFHYAGAFIFPKYNSVENEYRKLKEQHSN